ncbi:DUF6779 domain-containing protein [Nocardia vaccinii]|uniref:DUF6779 domain-containing protein n=1 Tax=Nocardia vaccinii TaxID=1822 RepID=UPI000829F5B9|nr:DUF6779 domain-containing protein [Nocardia vaccinii]
MVPPARSSTSRRRRVDAGKLIIGGLILLGLIASAFLIFSSSVQLVRVGLVVALWAAVIGALAASRYRREAAVDQAKVRDLRTVYKLQLEREITARREYELGVEARVRQEVAAEAGEMAALRAELTVLRESLQRLFDGDLLAERPALRADAIRLQELPGAFDAADIRANDNPEETDTWDAWSSPVVARYPVTPVFEPDHPEPPSFASPYDDPVTAETSVVTAEDLAAADAEDGTDSTSEHSAHAADTPPGPTPIGTTARRRRLAESGDGRKLSVAEIMANLQSERGAS